MRLLLLPGLRVVLILVLLLLLFSELTLGDDLIVDILLILLLNDLILGSFRSQRGLRPAGLLAEYLKLGESLHLLGFLNRVHHLSDLWGHISLHLFFIN